jgi:hypothetical protein
MKVLADFLQSVLLRSARVSPTETVVAGLSIGLGRFADRLGRWADLWWSVAEGNAAGVPAMVPIRCAVPRFPGTGFPADPRDARRGRPLLPLFAKPGPPLPATISQP